MAAIIAVLLTGLRILLMAKLGAMVARVLLFFGLTWATNEYVLDPALDQVRQYMTSGPGGELGATAMQWIGVMELDTAVSMVLSAVVAAWGIKQARVFLSKTE